MSRAKGYSSYRGRTPRGRIVLAGVLVLVILVALGCIVLQTLVVYDSSGNSRLQLPDLFGGEQVEEDLPQEDLDLTIEVPEIVLDAIAGYLAPEEPLTMEGLGSIEAALEQAGQGQRKYDTVAVLLKTSGGTVLFDSETALTGTVEMEPDTM